MSGFRGLAIGLCCGLGACTLIVDADPDALPELPYLPGAPDAGVADTGVAGAGGHVGEGGADAGQAGAAGSCADPVRCEDAKLTGCENGEPLSRTCPLGCGEDGASCADFGPSNLDEVPWPRDAQDQRIREDATFDTTACEAEGLVTRVVKGGEIELCVLEVNDLDIADDATWRIRGDRPFVVLAAGRVRIDGVLDASARGSTPGPGGGKGGSATERAEQPATGPEPGEAGELLALPQGGQWSSGGGGGGMCGAGGPGGGVANLPGGAAGDSVASDWLLVPLRGGSGGGRGRGGAVGTLVGGRGGAGGGAVQISARERIELRGAIWVGGGGGASGNTGSFGGAPGSGGGGGSGGAVLLESLEIRVDDGARISATGGGGGAAADPDAAGADGTARMDPAPGGASLAPSGGDSGGGELPEGQPGAAGTMDPFSAPSGGGGGGGAGCILLRSVEGEVPGDRGQYSPRSGRGLRALALAR